VIPIRVVVPFFTRGSTVRSLPPVLRFALRSLVSQRTVTIVAVTTLALSIGITTAVFSVVNGVVLRPLPFANPDRLVALCEVDRSEKTDWCGASVPDVYDIARRVPDIAVAGVARPWPFMMRTKDGAESVKGGLATAEAFRALGIAPLAGRLIAPDDIGSNWRRVVVLSNAVWRTRFGGRRDVIGEAITLDDEPHTIVGILPPNAALPQLEDVEMWRPVHVDPRDEQRRDWRGFLAFARLADGASLERTQQEVATVAADIQRQHFPTQPGWTIGVKPWLDVLVGSVRRTMYVFLGAVGFVLLIGCANVANLLLARSTVRQREMAVRTALGALRGALIRALLVESFVLALVGAAGGLLLGWWASRAFVALAPAGIPRIEQVGLDPRVLGFTAALSILTTLLVGAAPALRATRVNLHETLSEGGRSRTAGRRAARLGSALIVAEIALAVILVTGAGLLGRTFATLLDWRPGFEQQHLLTAWALASPGQFQKRQQVVDLWKRAEDELRSIPSVVSVGSGSAGPLFGGDGDQLFTIDGRTPAPGSARQAAFWFDISPSYFRTIGLPVLRGRDLSDRDVEGAPLVAVINETFAKRYLGAEPLGRAIHMTEHDADFTVVGVVRDVPPVRPGDGVPPQIFWSNRQVPRPATYFLVRTAGDPAPVAAAIRTRLHAVDAGLHVSAVRTMREWLSRDLVRPKFGAVLLTVFGVLALALVAIGTYGLIAYAVAQRTREIGIRLALGARPTAIVGQILGRGLELAGLGVGLGFIGALGLTRIIRGMLAGVSPNDPVSFGVSAALLIAGAALACVLPARRASRVDPLVALRAD
jgi:putative ABC transport system permease protein